MNYNDSFTLLNWFNAFQNLSETKVTREFAILNPKLAALACKYEVDPTALIKFGMTPCDRGLKREALQTFRIVQAHFDGKNAKLKEVANLAEETEQLKTGIQNHPLYNAEKQKAVDFKNQGHSWSDLENNKDLSYKRDTIQKYAKATKQRLKRGKSGRPVKE